MSEEKARPSDLPAVGRVLESDAFRAVGGRIGEPLAVALLREEIESWRARLAGEGVSRSRLERAIAPEALAAVVLRKGEALLAAAPRRVINATGVVAHTNLGRSILSADAARRVAETATGYVDLEYDLGRGARGHRAAHLAPLFERLFPGRASLAVNNNAAAILLAVRALAKGREVVVSRGELVEIGGSFRVPDILAASGAKLREVGTTNRTRLADYEAAVGPRTGLLLKVHTSNFRIEGFTEETTVAQLAGLARRAGVPLVVDWGSGDLVDLAPAGVRDEKTVGRLLDDGADLVTFSGDKLLGGPQAGIAIGREDLVGRMRRDPMARVLRLDRLLTAAMHATLSAYVRGRAFEEVPTLRLLSLAPGEIGRRAEAVRDEVARRTGRGAWISIEYGVSRPGGGSSPAGEIPTRLLVVARPESDAGPWEKALRLGDPPVVARVAEGRLILDLRTVLPEQDAIVASRLAEIVAGST